MLDTAVFMGMMCLDDWKALKLPQYSRNIAAARAQGVHCDISALPLTEERHAALLKFLYGLGDCTIKKIMFDADMVSHYRITFPKKAG